MISVKNLTKSYGSFKAINNLNFNISSGEIIGFLGPNGAGKTTTMKLLTCFMPPSSGEILINGLSIHDQSLEIRKQLGYLPENTPLYENMTVYDYLLFIGKIRLLSDSIISEAIERVVHLCKLQSVIHKYIYTCSKGFKQRIGIAQAIIHNPALLILDEATSGLDPSQIIDMRHLIKDISKTATIIICSHILSEVTATCSRVFILNRGSIIADGSPTDLLQDKQFIINISTTLPYPRITKLFSKLHDLKSINIISDKDNIYSYDLYCMSDIRESLFSLCANNNVILSNLSLRESNLEDMFISLTKDTKNDN